MKINIQVIQGQIKGNFRQLLRRRVLKLETYSSNILAADVSLTKDSSDKKIGYHAKIKLSIRGYDIFGKSKAGDFEEAVNSVIESLRKKLRRKKTKKKLNRHHQINIF